MGFKDAIKQGIQDAKEKEAARPAQPSAPAVPNWYLTEVNKGSIRMQSLQSHLNAQRQRGYRLAHILEQSGNTVMIFEWVGEGEPR